MVLGLQHPVRSLSLDTSPAGGWWVFARPRGLPVAEVSYFRGAPTLIGDFSFEDPGGPKDLSLMFPSISAFDRLGYGDLYWLQKKVSIDIIWAGELPDIYPFGRYRGHGETRTWLPSFAWEGFLTGFSFSKEGMNATGKGEMYQLDDYLAKPEFLTRPLPYEHAMARQFLEKPHLRMSRMRIYWPDWWDRTYSPPAKDTPSYLVPAGVRKGQNWTGLLTRSTGSWDSTYSSYLTTMLQGMYTRHGRWTLDLARGRVPELLHHTMLSRARQDTVIIDPVDPSVDLSEISVDWSQSLDVVYGQGTSLTGVAYSGMEFANDGSRAYYVPLAASRQAYPAEDNDWLDLAAMPRETQLQFPPGLDEYEASKVAAAHLERFGDPGITGTMVLKGDVRLNNGALLPHHLVRAGMSAKLPGLFGRPEGSLVHISASTASLKDRQTTLTFDSKYRDALTVAEVRLRGRDAMAISRMLIAGQYSPPLPDQLLPWDYGQGSGVIPYTEDARAFFDAIPDRMQFPWVPWTTTHPPKKARWRHAYIHIGPASSHPDKNWSGKPHVEGGTHFAIPVKMSQAGQIRLLQIGAYDQDGNVLKVPFHVSFYYMKNTNWKSMPKVRQVDADDPTQPFTNPDVGEHSPWVKDAWEDYNSDGTLKSTEVPQPVRSAGLWKAYGNLQIKAGYFPGDGSPGDTVTGLLQDETMQGFDTTRYGQFDPYSPKGNLTNPDAGMLYVMIYCDAQATSDVYFLGRMFRVEPGTTVGAG